MSCNASGAHTAVVCLRAASLITACLWAHALVAQSAAFGVIEAAVQWRASMTLAELRDLVQQRIADSKIRAADDHLLTAELLKQLGDPRAAEYYENAIAADPKGPAYELFYGDYLRNFRGPRRPLFEQAEERYRNALEKALRDPAPDSAVVDRIDRSLAALHQEDGVPLAWDGDGTPSVFLTSVYRYARSTADLDEIHDTRDFTSEALFASSTARLNRPLTTDELRAVVRRKEPFATLQRVRFRGGGTAADFFYQGRQIESAQITNFFEPGSFNDVTLHTLGAGVEHTAGLASGLDVYWRAGYSGSRREGVIEFLPSTTEAITQFDFRTAVARFIGPDKLNVEAVYARQSLKWEHLDDPPTRNRQIAAVTGEYQVLRPLPLLGNPYSRLFAVRGVHLRGGVAFDDERFGAVTVSRRDYFAGASINGLGRFDVTVQPALIESRVSGDPHQTHSHFRLDANVVIRLLDEERQPGIPRTRFLGLHPAFVHLVLPFRKDDAREGLDAFENDKVGAALAVKLFRRSLPAAPGEGARVRPLTVLASVGYDRQRFRRLDTIEQLFHVTISLGY